MSSLVKGFYGGLRKIKPVRNVRNSAVLRAHNPKVAGSNPAPATIIKSKA